MSDAAKIQEMLETAPLEDVALALIAARGAIAEEDPDALCELELAIYDRVLAQPEWIDAAKGSRALHLCVDIALGRDLADGDTVTSLLIKAIELTPDDDALVLEYLRSAVDTDYRYTDRSLLDVAKKHSSPERARRLALLDTIAEYHVLAPYLDPPRAVYVDAMKRSFAAAIALGGDEAQWLDARSWVLAAIPFARLPADVFAKYAPAS